MTTRQKLRPIAGLVAWTVALLATAASGSADQTRTFRMGGHDRSYLVHVPPRYDSSRATPVVLAFHGGGGNAHSMVQLSGLNEKADREGFVVVYPNGTGRVNRGFTFNAGNCCGYAMENSINDVEFTRLLLDDLATMVNVDRRRVFATGMSNGAMMAYRLAAELSDRIAAVAPVAGPVGTASISPKRPVSVMHFHGTDDENAPFGGGRGKGISGTNFYSVDYSIQAWVKANGCQTQPVVTTLPDAANDGTTVSRRAYGSGKDGSEVVLIVIEGGGHTWPGREPRPRSLGKATRDISASDQMWEFFQRHPMR